MVLRDEIEYILINLVCGDKIQDQHKWTNETLAAVVKWGNEECNDHAYYGCLAGFPKPKKHLCSECWASLEQEAREEKGK